MFKATFLGHQGWLFRTSTTTVLLDPLLTERFGHGGALGRMFPPRQLDVAAFPPVDAVILTHEHDDHFDVPSLHRLSRSIPVHLSVRSSSSAHALLQRMGFTVRPLLPDHELAIGDLRYRTFVAEGIGAAGSDEWDVFPFVLRDSQGHGSFVSSIDVGLPERMLEQLPALAPRPAELARLAADTFAEGCVGETIAALVAHRAASRCTDPEVRRCLEVIADDEARHAALAWSTIAWARHEGGASVDERLREVAQRLRAASVRSLPPADPEASSLAVHGRLDARAQAQAARDGWDELIGPMLDSLLAEPAHDGASMGA